LPQDDERRGRHRQRRGGAGRGDGDQFFGACWARRESV
jgi:hypothetical protein